MITATLTKYFGTGPKFKEFNAESDKSCANTWWYNLLFINNIFYKTEVKSTVCILLLLLEFI